MSFKVSTTAQFESDAKILQKRHCRSFKNDLKDLIILLRKSSKEVELSPGIQEIKVKQPAQKGT